ncbi:MAG: Xaa-Pro peptidase family protein [Halobacteriales archaeon]|nr:Xaa-Pro peptidase family protein [Halobacteriales archaeon]
MAEELSERCPDVEFVDVSTAWHDLTAVKTPAEIELIEEAIRIAELGMETAIEHAVAGATEREVAIEAEYAMRKAGSEMEPFIFDLCAGRNAGVFNRIPTEHRLRDGDLVAMDMGAVYRGYNGEFARSVSVGTPSQKQREVYQTVYESLQAGLEAIEPGTPCQVVDEAVREVIREAGYTKYMHDRDTGHQTAFGLHGNPAIAPDETAPLEPGMVVNIEPRIAMFDDPAVGGVQLEEIVLVEEDGTRLLTTTPFDETLLDQ